MAQTGHHSCSLISNCAKFNFTFNKSTALLTRSMSFESGPFQKGQAVLEDYKPQPARLLI